MNYNFLFFSAFLGGFAALGYEVIWFKSLPLLSGGGAKTFGVLLGIFLLGISIGTHLAPKISVKRSAILSFALVEFLAAFFSLIGFIYLKFVFNPFKHMEVRWVVIVLSILLPTVFLGSSLAIIARYFQIKEKGDILKFYSLNLYGAFWGSIILGFYLLPHLGFFYAGIICSSLNLLAAMFALLGRRKEVVSEQQCIENEADGNTEGVYGAFVAGFIAFAVQVVWLKHTSLNFGETSYLVSSVIATALLGSAFGTFLIQKFPLVKKEFLSFMWIIVLASSMIIIFAFEEFQEFYPDESYNWHKNWLIFAYLIPLALMNTITGCMYAKTTQQMNYHSQIIKKTYLFNTLGAGIGSISTSLILIPVIGSEKCFYLIFLSGVFYLCPNKKGTLTLTAFAIILLFILPGFSDLPALGGIHYRTHSKFVKEKHLVEESINSTYGVYTNTADQKVFVSGGRIQATDNIADLRAEFMLGHLPALYSNKHERSLVIGYGTGISAGALLVYPEMEVDVVDIQKELPLKVGPYFKKYNRKSYAHPQVKNINMDGRLFTFTSSQKYDVISTDPTEPWFNMSGGLFTYEYFKKLRNMLKVGGALSLWTCFCGTNETSAKIITKTFLKVFPQGGIYLNPDSQDVIFLAKKDFPLYELGKRLVGKEILRDLQFSGYKSVDEINKSLLLKTEKILEWASDVPVNTDENMLLTFTTANSIMDEPSNSILIDLVDFYYDKKFSKKSYR